MSNSTLKERSDFTLDLGLALERVGTWIRHVTPRFEWNTLALSVLAQVDRNGPLRITDLVASERITQPGMTSLVRRLAAAKLVRRSPDPADGRATLVSATDQGRAYLAEIHEIRARVIAEHLKTLSITDRQSLKAAIDAMDALSASLILREDSAP